MKNVADLHEDHKELISEVNFLKIEINFLLKLLNKSYKKLMNHEKVILLDSYWIRFEKNIDKLDLLLKEIKKEENEIGKLYEQDLIDPEKIQYKDNITMIKDFYLINRDVKILKESFYEFIAREVSTS